MASTETNTGKSLSTIDLLDYKSMKKHRGRGRAKHAPSVEAERYEPSPETGLTAEQVAKRTEDGFLNITSKTGGKTGRDLVMDYLARVAGEATEERLAEIAPVNHVDRYMAPTFVWGVADDKTCPIVQVHEFACAMARAPPSPSGAGAVMWCASQVTP